MGIRVTKSSGDVYADLGIKKRGNPHHGSTLESFLKEEGILAVTRATAIKEVARWKRRRPAKRTKR
jgi:hypothetical protein